MVESTDRVMNIYQFMSDSPFLTFFLTLFLTFFLAVVVAHLVIDLVKYPLRAMNIRKHGWPPAHCDADGDFKEADGE